MAFIRQSAPEIKKLQKLDSVFEIDPSQLVDVVLTSIQQQGTMTEARRCKTGTGFLVAALKTGSNLRRLRSGSVVKPATSVEDVRFSPWVRKIR